MTTPTPTADQLFDAANRQMRAGEWAAAEASLRDLLSLDPDLPEAHANLAYLLEILGHPAAAENHYRQALNGMPDQPQTHINLGALLAAQKRDVEAEAAYRRALQLDPASPAAWSNLGVLLAYQKRETEAEACYRTALAHAPEHRNAAFNLAYLLLRQGRYEEGWRRLEARDWYAQIQQHLDIPRWQGESLAGKSLLIGLEAGHGDMIQFCRYGQQLKTLGAARVSVLCHSPLKTLFTRLDGIDDAIAVGDPDPGFGWDFWSPPLSLPYHLGTRLDTIPADQPYLHADPDKVARWRIRLGENGGKLRVGLVWKGNPRFENDAERSLQALNALAPLGEIPGIQWISLQKGAGEDEAMPDEAPFPILPLGGEIDDFADSAAIMAHLDLIISVDTAAAHLAGALSRPCWVLLPHYKTDWRWLDRRSDSPWYPDTMRLFRQDASARWEPVIRNIRNELEEWVARSTRPQLTLP